MREIENRENKKERERRIEREKVMMGGSFEKMLERVAKEVDEHRLVLTKDEQGDKELEHLRVSILGIESILRGMRSDERNVTHQPMLALLSERYERFYGEWVGKLERDPKCSRFAKRANEALRDATVVLARAGMISSDPHQKPSDIEA